ncbi:DUF4376 domain-containing protein [Dissulfurirhabdus thermomarina]|uniref:DUF4376 domain-containing protein n=1 Tax=Dissulfurirhabdus thermomarina TaxID=1765737 RepID=A0A6N9TJI7_DISTH|nr:DUF4376 domain-containing protein [Dissulfurirhabdus thermomarina]NDY41239.1 DUF4376 domain-containing protein [Dissulfurirhabdus thermomarina]
MAKYAYYDSSAPQPTPVLGWYHVRDTQDPDGLDYPNLPPAADLLVLTDAEWAARLDQRWHVQAGALVPDPGPSLEEVRTAKRIEMQAACKAACEAGWTSSALGSPHLYGTRLWPDQHNLAAVALDAVYAKQTGDTTWTTNYWATPSGASEPQRLSHTADQILQVAREVKAMVAGNQDKLAQRYAEIDAATTVAEVQAVVWV